MPLIAIFANLSLPTQAALPELNATDWTVLAASGAMTGRAGTVDAASASVVPDGAWPRLNRAGMGARIASVKDGRWWAVRRALRDVSRTGLSDAAVLSDPEWAIARGFPARPLDGEAPVLVASAAPKPFQRARLVLAPADPLSAFAAMGVRLTPPLGKGDHAWMRRPIPENAFTAEQQQCLATAIYFEARGEKPKGQAAVAQVILNRVRNPAYPDTICGVVYQNAKLRNRCQFSFACDGLADRFKSRRAYERAQRIAMAVTRGETFVSEIGSSTHYFADYVRPKWAGSMVKMASIGTHHFFRTHKGGWK